jgi:thiamine pyridinylase
MWAALYRRILAILVAAALTLVVIVALREALKYAAADRPPGPNNARHLRVVIYPFIPDYPGFVKDVGERFSATPEGRGVTIDFIDLTDGYYNSSSDKFVGAVPADVYEQDSVLLKDFVDAHKIRTLPSALTPLDGEFVPAAQRRAYLENRLYGYPHWICANFLFYRKGDSAVGSAGTLADLERILGSSSQSPQPLLADFKGGSTLGEFYLMSLFGRYGDWSGVEAHLDGLDASKVNDVVRLAALCRAGHCHSGSRHDAPGSYGRAFARGGGRVLIGYSELLYYVGAEQQLCHQAEGCLCPRDLDAALVPLDDRGVTPMLWVDSYVLSSSCTDQPCEHDAVNFIRFVNSQTTQHQMLTGSPARYLLPARASLYSDPEVLKAAPLYPKLRSLVENAESPSASGLSAKLRVDGNAIDGKLPPPHQSNPCP